MRISDWSSDVCSSDLLHPFLAQAEHDPRLGEDRRIATLDAFEQAQRSVIARAGADGRIEPRHGFQIMVIDVGPRIDDRRHSAVGLVAEIGGQYLDRRFRRLAAQRLDHLHERSEEQTSDLLSLMRISYPVF